jgi:hypothetical protein
MQKCKPHLLGNTEVQSLGALCHPFLKQNEDLII